jgi:hypothetical protein
LEKEYKTFINIYGDKNEKKYFTSSRRIFFELPFTRANQRKQTLS